MVHHHHPRCYNPCRVLTNSIISLHPSLSMALVLQFLIPSLPASLFTPSIHLRLGLPTLLLPSGIPRVIFLHGRLSCIRTMCPAHLNLVFLIAVTRVKNINKYIEKNCVSRWLFNKNHYMMHGQQNIESSYNVFHWIPE